MRSPHCLTIRHHSTSRSRLLLLRFVPALTSKLLSTLIRIVSARQLQLISEASSYSHADVVVPSPNSTPQKSYYSLTPSPPKRKGNCDSLSLEMEVAELTERVETLEKVQRESQKAMMTTQAELINRLSVLKTTTQSYHQSSTHQL